MTRRRWLATLAIAMSLAAALGYAVTAISVATAPLHDGVTPATCCRPVVVPAPRSVP